VKRKIFCLGVACLLLILIVTALFGKKGVMELRQARRDLALRAERIKALEAEKARLEAEIERLENDPRAVEKSARERLGLVEPGEKVIVAPSSPAKK
jgi:cell division protein FtsB